MVRFAHRSLSGGVCHSEVPLKTGFTTLVCFGSTGFEKFKKSRDSSFFDENLGVLTYVVAR